VLGRTLRAITDPIMKPVERRLVRMVAIRCTPRLAHRDHAIGGIVLLSLSVGRGDVSNANAAATASEATAG